DREEEVEGVERPELLRRPRRDATGDSGGPARDSLARVPRLGHEAVAGGLEDLDVAREDRVVTEDGGAEDREHPRDREPPRERVRSPPHVDMLDQRVRPERGLTSPFAPREPARVAYDPVNVGPLPDLHRHLDGSLRPGTVRELAAKKGVAVPPDLRFRQGMGLAAALERSRFTLSLLDTADAVRRVAREICEDAA